MILRLKIRMKYYLDQTAVYMLLKNITYSDMKLLLEMQLIRGTESLDTKGTVC